MNLNSKQNLILLCNCIRIKLRQIDTFEQTSSDYSDTKKAYTELLELFKNGKIQKAINLLKFSDSTQDFNNFSKEILNESPKNIADKYINLVQSLMKASNIPYSQEKFEQFKEIFYTGNKDLINQNSSRFSNYEEEPEEEATFSQLTPDMQLSLDELNKLIKLTNPKTLNPRNL